MTDFEKITFKKFDGANYPVWSAQMFSLLVLKGFDTAVQDDSDANSDKARALIMLNVDEHHISQIIGLQTAREVWERLEDTYKSRSLARELQLRKELNTLQMQPNETLQRYVSRARDIMYQLAAAGVSLSERDVVISVLGGLLDKYEMLRTVLENSATLPSLDEVLSKGLTVEQRMKTREEDNAVKAFVTPSSSSRINNPARESRECYYCHKKGHLANVCRKKKADMARGQRTRPVVALAATSGTFKADTWVLDSAATYHMAHDTSVFDRIYKLQDPIQVMVGGGNIMTATTAGEVRLHPTGGCYSVRLKHVLYLPGLGVNLLSVNSLTSYGAKVTFDGITASATLHGKTVLTANYLKETGVYVVNNEASARAAAALYSKSSTVSAELWHRRFGHLGYSNMARLPSMVKGMHITAEEFKSAGEKSCAPCIMGKQKRQPFPGSDTSTGT